MKAFDIGSETSALNGQNVSDTNRLSVITLALGFSQRRHIFAEIEMLMTYFVVGKLLHVPAVLQTVIASMAGVAVIPLSDNGFRFSLSIDLCGPMLPLAA